MRSLKINLILWLSIALTSELVGQSPYTFLLKGQVSPYDSGVVINLYQYRRETKKLKMGDQLVDSLMSEIKSWRLERIKADSVIADQSRSILIQAKEIDRKEKTIFGLNKNFGVLQEETIKLNRYRWIEDPKVIIPGGVLLGMILHAIISK